MALDLKDEWENFVVEQLRGPYIKEFGKLKTDGERYKFCKYIIRNSGVAQEIVEQIQKLLNTRVQQKPRSVGNGQEYVCVGEEHFRRRDFKKAVISFSLAIQQAILYNAENQKPLSKQQSDMCDLALSDSADNTSRSPGQLSLVSLYTRRAEILFQAQEYKACLNDIQEASSLQCPQAPSGKLDSLQKACEKKLSTSVQNLNHGDDTSTNIPLVTGGPHDKIANGSRLIEINCTATQGRFLKASDNIRAGDTLISEPPYAAVLLPENTLSHCDCCFQPLVAPFPCRLCCEVQYCSQSCRDRAWSQYHKVECSLGPLLKMMDTFFQLSLRILLVTGTENIFEFLQASSSKKIENTNLSRMSGCGPEGEYLGDYGSVFSLVTNTELQPVKTLMSHALNCALLAEFLEGVMVREDDLNQRPVNCENCTKNRLCQSHELQHEHLEQYYNVQNFQSFFPNESCTSSVAGDVIGCLLFHHSQQMACNVHAITAIVSTGEDKTNLRTSLPTKDHVVSREQKRIATAVYPTASLLNHACDPDVIVSFVDGYLVVRATHNIAKGSEISHCYGPHVSRMGREDRQKLLYKQYFFTCQCTACKSDEEMESKRLCFSAFACPQCKHAMKLSPVSDGVIGTCQNRECNLEKNMLDECRLAREAELLFVKGVRLLERVGVKEALDVFHECLRRRKILLHAYNKDLAETHDAIARCYAMNSDFMKASHYCSRSCEAVEKAFGSSSVEYAHELHKLSQLLFNDRQVKKALSTIDKATRLLSRHYGRSNPDVKELSEMKRHLIAVGGHSRNNST